VSAGIATIEFGGHDDEAHAEADQAEAEGEHHHEGADPHSWQSVPNVMVWTQNVATALSALDPANAVAYAAAAKEYQAQLEALNSELHALADELPAEQRKLVTDHDSLGYLAHEYGFTVIGTVIPSLSTVASPSAQELAALEEQVKQEGVKAIIVGTTVNPQLSDQIASDLGIQVAPIFTDSLSDANGPAATYVDFMRYNLQTIVDALR
jgi:ABC-type Zn uptake system ZnuABC Zn-binding protein ZnuA